MKTSEVLGRARRREAQSGDNTVHESDRSGQATIGGTAECGKRRVPYSGYLQAVKHHGLSYGQFVQVPRGLLVDSGISHACFRLWCTLADHVRYGGTSSECFAGLPRLASLLGRSERQVRRDRAWLREHGLIEVRHQGRRTYYKLFVPTGAPDILDASADELVPSKETDLTSEETPLGYSNGEAEGGLTAPQEREVEPFISRASDKERATCLSVILEELQAAGISEQRALDLVATFGEERARRALDTYDRADGRGRVWNPAGFVVQMIETDCGHEFDLDRHLKTRRRDASGFALRNGLDFNGDVDDAEYLLMTYGTKSAAYAELDTLIEKYSRTKDDPWAIADQRHYAERMLDEAVDAKAHLAEFPFEDFDHYASEMLPGAPGRAVSPGSQ